ncbi:hypothetical protein CM49_00509 [Paenibacillus sp. P1XP2]|nr:hypothetical protein CM49_00509 [Paenibacillus sp. P1XP2]
MMNKRWLLIGLHEFKGLGRKSIARILSEGMLSEEMIHFNSRDWEKCGFSAGLSERLAKELTADYILRKREEKERDAGTRVVTILDEHYPALLKESPDPPHVLYGKGDLRLLHVPSVAMVGTRVPTAYGRKMGAELAQGLCEAGLAVVSGSPEESTAFATKLRYYAEAGRLRSLRRASISFIRRKTNRFLPESAIAD